MSQLNGFQSQMNQIGNASYSGIAMAGALAGLPQVDVSKKYQFSAGVSSYDGYSALAIGASARITQNTIIKLGVSGSNASHLLINAGMGYSW